MSEPVTTLVAAFPSNAPPSQPVRARDLLLRAEATGVTLEDHAGGSRIHGWFGSAAEAVLTALDLVPAHDDPGIRVVISTAPAPDRPDRLAPLLARSGVGQITVTASTAIVAGAALPRGAQLYYRGRWRPAATGPPEQVYELRPPGNDVDAEPDNLHWARRVLAGTRPTPTPAAARALAVLRDDWRRVLSGELMTHVLSAATPLVPGTVSAELALRLHADSARVLYGRWERDPTSECQALLEALAVYADGRPAHALRADIAGRADLVSRLLPEVGSRLGLPARPLPDVERAEAFEAIEDWLTSLAAQRPTLIVLHDLSPADRLSAQLLGHLRMACRRSRIMLVVTTTDRAPAPALDDLLALAGPGEDATLRHFRLD